MDNLHQNMYQFIPLLKQAIYNTAYSYFIYCKEII